MILSFDLLTSKYKYFIFIPKCTKVVNLVKFCQVVYKILCSQTFRMQPWTTQKTIIQVLFYH